MAYLSISWNPVPDKRRCGVVRSGMCMALGFSGAESEAQTDESVQA